MTATADKSSSGADTEQSDSGMAAAEADSIGNGVSEQSDTLIKNMDIMSDAIPGQDNAAFDQAQGVIKSALESISTQLKDIPNSESALNGLQDATSSYITAARAFFKNPESEAHAKKYTDTQKDFSVAMKQLLFQVTRRNRLVGRSLSRGFSKRSLTQNLRNSVMSGGSNRLTRDGSGRSLNIGSSSSPEKSQSSDKLDSPAKTPEKSPEKPISSGSGSAPSSEKLSSHMSSSKGDDLPSTPTKTKTGDVPKSESKSDSKADKSDHKPKLERSKTESPANTTSTSKTTSSRSSSSSSDSPKMSKEDKQSSKLVIVGTEDKVKSVEKMEDSLESSSSSPMASKKRDKREKEKSKEKRDKEKAKDKKEKEKRKATLTSSPTLPSSSTRNVLTGSSSSNGAVSSSPSDSPLKRQSFVQDEMSEEAPQVTRLRNSAKDITTSSDSEGESSTSKDTSASKDTSSSKNVSLAPGKLSVPEKRESMRRIHSSELLGEISSRAARQEEAAARPTQDDSELDGSLIDDSRDDEEENDKPSMGRIRPAVSVSSSSNGPNPSASASSHSSKRPIDNDKQHIAQRIIDSFCERFPGFKTEWEAADPMKKVLTENKIVSELAMYQIVILQSHPGALPGTGPATTASAIAAPTDPSSAAAPPGSPGLDSAKFAPLGIGGAVTSSTSSGTASVKLKNSKEKQKSTASLPETKKFKKANTPASLSLWESKDKSPTKDLSGSSKDKSPRSGSGGASSSEDNKEEVDAELQRIAAMKSPADLGGMTMRLKGGLRTLMGKSPTQKPTGPVPAKLPESAIEASHSFCAALLEFLDEVHDHIREPTTYVGEKCESLVENEKQLLAHLKTLVSGIRTLVSIPSGTAPGQSVLSDVLNRIEDEVNLVREGALDEMDSKLLAECQYVKLARDNVERSLFRWCSGLYYTVAQIGTDVSALAKLSEMDQEVEATVIHALSLIGAFFNLLTMLMNDLITLNYIVVNSDASSSSKTIAPSPRFSVNSSGVPIWSEPEAEPTGEKDVGTFRTGTLNQLIVRLLTMPTDRFTETFMDTFTSFTTASSLIDKLYEAVVQLPKDKFDKPKTVKILSAVCDVLGKLIKNGFRYDFDEHCIPKIRKLLGELAKTIDVGIQVQQLIILVKNSEEEEKQREPMYLDIPKEVQTFEGDSLPHAFLLSFDATTIAQQLTYIEFDIYRSITSDELKNQSWNKPKRMCIARNVCALIQRANRVSLWVSTAILLQPKVKDRARVILKVIHVAKALRELGNYNTLMGIIAGLNMSCVSRLKQTMAAVGRKPLDTLKILQNIVDPTSSFKTLRETLRQGGPTQLPYIGTTLTDLTFIEDGNADTFTHPTSKKEVINMEKRDLLATCIRSVRAFQTSDYKITLRDPPHTFLHELPCLDEQLLYALSLEREPRTNDTFRKGR